MSNFLSNSPMHDYWIFSKIGQNDILTRRFSGTFHRFFFHTLLFNCSPKPLGLSLIDVEETLERAFNNIYSESLIAGQKRETEMGFWRKGKLSYLLCCLIEILFTQCTSRKGLLNGLVCFFVLLRHKCTSLSSSLLCPVILGVMPRCSFVL